MAQIVRGVKAGTTAGGFSGFILALIGTGFLFLTSPVSFSGMGGLIIGAMFIILIIRGIVDGAILGVIFAALYEKLPSNNVYVKSLTVAIAVFLFFYFIITVIAPSTLHTAMLGADVFAALFIGAGILEGVLLGAFWKGFA